MYNFIIDYNAFTFGRIAVLSNSCFALLVWADQEGKLLEAGCTEAEDM